MRKKMNTETELTRIKKENDTLRKIIETQQKTIQRLVDYFILEKTDTTSDS